jgi:ATP-dependent DNA helicase RecQ
MKKLGEDVTAEEGRALAPRRRRLGPAVQAGRREGRFGDELVGRPPRPSAPWRPPGTLRSPRCHRNGTLVPDFAQRLASALGLRSARSWSAAGDNPPSAR